MTQRPLSILRWCRLAALVLGFGPTAVHAQDKVTVTTTWFAQAEHGGVYQALATGLYKKHGLDVTIRMGGPQVNGIQLLLAGQSDFIMNYDFAVLSGVERGFPLVTVAAPFQFDIQGLLTHEDVKDLSQLKDKTILVAGTGTTYWWPWVKKKYGLTDAHMRPYTFNMQPFFADKNIVQQAFPSSEPYQAQQKGVKTNFFLLSAQGYPPYTQAITTTRKMVEERPDVVQRFVRATIEGWKSYIQGDPTPANELIKKDNPNMTDGQIAFGIAKLKEMQVVTGGDAARFGIGIMTDERWEKTAKFMVEWGLLKPDTDWRKAYTTRFVKDLQVMP
ncbi:ABC transporter substrate-binding protein [Calidifontimicrobium sp. SYSU G02091]|uniref:ABC transporter substrate-binding protein n=1 Tax=Calidifontimicrobium sp. SYSU G02091 TaxID=2926421 RepID=UPI001F5308FC|nr:ABC transporter substrate-binding protein [Calidifontimicrobium sp. SYSU G02091]MCI1192420.1 ABC transporter substrate-binding protein [Calidifontimicrobium sp. SYSU G02091]